MWRVDADLWHSKDPFSGDNVQRPRNAGLGQGGAVWAPIIEKAWAFYRKFHTDIDGNVNYFEVIGSYGTITGGDYAYRENLGLTDEIYLIEDNVSPEAFISIVESDNIWGQLILEFRARSMLQWVKDRMAASQAVITGAVSRISDNTPFIYHAPGTPNANLSTYRRGRHIYTVDEILYDENGLVDGVILRDPYGSPRELHNLLVIYFCLYGMTALEM